MPDVILSPTSTHKSSFYFTALGELKDTLAVRGDPMAELLSQQQ